MSYDIDVATHDKPIKQIYEDFVKDCEGSIYCRYADNIINIENSQGGHVLSIDGPYRIQPEDINDGLSSNVIAPNWLINIVVPESAEQTAIVLARELSCYIAKACRGAAYDLNRELLLWPKKTHRRFITNRNEERINLINLDWFICNTPNVKNLIEMFLDLVRRYCVEALPKRFGPYEPFRYNYSEDDSDFIDMCDKFNSNINPQFLFWNSNSPCFGGSIIFPDSREGIRPSGAYPCIKISLSFDGKAVLYDSRWMCVIERMFAKIANALNAFYAAGYVTKNVIAKNNSVFFDSKTQESPLAKSKDWVGLPEKPVWLSWYGPPYMDLVKSYLDKHKIIVYPQGILLKLSNDPFNINKFVKDFNLPKNLIVSYEVDKKKFKLLKNFTRVKKKTNISLSKKVKAAEFVPSLP